MDTISTRSIVICIGVVASIGITGSSFQPQSSVQILGFSGVICAQLIAILQSRRNAIRVEKTAEKAAEHVAEVKEILRDESSKTSDKLNGLAQVVDNNIDISKKVLIHVNKKYGDGLEVAMKASVRLAEMSGQLDDVKNAEKATRLYKEHMEGQQRIDDIDKNKH